ncbi:MAG: hypothetical protein R3288_06085 [Woeseiaceae bacterium]|nr:hypothetical protein [Woeseiaceae bacterium]
MIHKLLLINVLFFFCIPTLGQDAGSVPAPSTPGAMLASARTHVENGDAQAAVAVLEQLAAGGFTGVTAITGDAVLNRLAGEPAYDDLVAAMSVQAFPCEHDQRFREFDFWIGDWDVHVAGGQFAGHNRITAEQAGCVLVESWASATGGTGHSINYFDEARGDWVQIWNDSGGNQIQIRGGLTPSGMLLTGTIHYVATDQTAGFRGLWTPLEDGRVRQFFEQSNDGGETWAPWFEGFYTRRSKP